MYQQKYDKKGRPIGISFADLDSRQQNFLIKQAPDTTNLVNGSRQIAISEFMKIFLEYFPELSESIENQATMQRLMQAGIKARKITAARVQLSRHEGLSGRKGHLVLSSF